MRKAPVKERWWRFIPSDRSPDECWEWTGARFQDGYGALLERAGVTVRAHRVAYQIFHGEIPDGYVVRHRCDNNPCVNPSHLEVGTYADNVRDSFEHGKRLDACSSCGGDRDFRTPGCETCRKRLSMRRKRNRIVAALAEGLQ